MIKNILIKTFSKVKIPSFTRVVSTTKTSLVKWFNTNKSTIVAAASSAGVGTLVSFGINNLLSTAKTSDEDLEGMPSNVTGPMQSIEPLEKSLANIRFGCSGDGSTYDNSSRQQALVKGLMHLAAHVGTQIKDEETSKIGAKTFDYLSACANYGLLPTQLDTPLVASTMIRNGFSSRGINPALNSAVMMAQDNILIS